MRIVALLTPRFSKQILKEHSQIDNFNAKKLWGKKGNGVGQKHIDVWYTSFNFSKYLELKFAHALDPQSLRYLQQKIYLNFDLRV